MSHHFDYRGFCIHCHRTITEVGAHSDCPAAPVLESKWERRRREAGEWLLRALIFLVVIPFLAVRIYSSYAEHRNDREHAEQLYRETVPPLVALANLEQYAPEERILIIAGVGAKDWSQIIEDLEYIDRNLDKRDGRRILVGRLLIAVREAQASR